MARLVLSRIARNDIDEIWQYIGRTRSEPIADAVLARLYGAMDVLTHVPHIGREREEFIDKPRSFAVRPHVIFYEPLKLGDGIAVWRVLHGARDLRSLDAAIWRRAAMTSIYDFSAETLQGKTAPLADYRGKPMLIVNTASKCGFTPQYEGLEKLYQAHRGQGLVVLGFPCNQFGGQEPGSAEDIGSFCQVNYGVSFPMFAKIDVNGPKTHPLYEFLKAEKPGVLGTRNIKWNFTKFLIDRAGKVVARFGSMTKPADMEQAIQKVL